MARFAPCLIVLASLAGSPVHAAEDCAGIKDDARRLACYDTIHGGVATETSPTTAAGNWHVSVTSSPMTDETTVIAHLESADHIDNRFGMGTGPATLVLRCQESTTVAYFRFNDRFMAGIQGYGRVEYRLDKEKMQSASMDESTDNMALGLWNGRSAIPFIKSLYDHEALVVRATPFNESAITVTFDIRGTEAATKQLRETCRW